MEDTKDILLLLIKIAFYFFSCEVFVLCCELIKQPFGIVLTVSLILLTQTRVYINITLSIHNYLSIKYFWLVGCFFCFVLRHSLKQPRPASDSPQSWTLGLPTSVSWVLGLQVCATTPRCLCSQCWHFQIQYDLGPKFLTHEADSEPYPASLYRAWQSDIAEPHLPYRVPVQSSGQHTKILLTSVSTIK